MRKKTLEDALDRSGPVRMLMLLFLAAGSLLGQETPAHSTGSELKYVVFLSRHGVRPPTWSADQLNQYSTKAWPEWDVPAGNLTSHGKTLMKLFGAYDRAYLSQAGLLEPTGCADTGHVYFWTDADERTIETGRALAAGLLPGCEIEVHSLPEGTTDALFSPVAAGIGNPDRALAAAAVAGRIGGKPKALLEAYRPSFETMRQVLLGCKPVAKCPPEGMAVRQSLLELPASVDQGKGDHLAELSGPLSTASTLAEDFLLEYTNGMESNDLGWGRVNESNLREMMSLHTAYADLLRRTPYIARVQASNLLSHILKSMEQAIAGKAVASALGKADNRVVVIVGHDGNLSNVSGTLGLSWLVEGYQRDDTPPGGALVFELWRQVSNQEYFVRTYYTCQTLEQMRKGLPLTLNSPPARAAVFVPGCSTAGAGFPCGWKAFQHAVETAIDQAFVKP